MVRRQNPHLTWIGLIDTNNQIPYVFRWIDGTGTLDYTNWYSIYPYQIPDENCVYMIVNNVGNNGKWANSGCRSLLLSNFVCKRSAFSK
jgi:hypothetical protein